VWFNDFEDIGTVGAGGKPRFVFRSDRVGLPDAMVAGPDGALWFTDESIPASIGRISAAGVVTRYRIPTPAAGWVLAGLEA
jgi:streptogramin lyase